MFGVYFQLSLASRQLLLLETLKVKQTILDPVPTLLKLPIAVSCYWLQHTGAKAKLHHLQALLLGMLMGPLHAIINSPGRYMEIPVYFCMLLTCNQKFKQKNILGLSTISFIRFLDYLLSYIRNFACYLHIIESLNKKHSWIIYSYQLYQNLETEAPISHSLVNTFEHFHVPSSVPESLTLRAQQ